MVKITSSSSSWHKNLESTRDRERKETSREMGSVSNIGLTSVFKAPLDMEVVSKQRYHKSPCSFTVPKPKSNYSVRLSQTQICCKLSESGIEENPRSKSASKSKDRMEEYNIAMRRRMRNPYEYHHDLGQFYFHLYPICLLLLHQLLDGVLVLERTDSMIL